MSWTLSVALIYKNRLQMLLTKSCGVFLQVHQVHIWTFLAVTSLSCHHRFGEFVKAEDAAPVAGIEELPLTAPLNRLGGRD